MQPRWYQAEAVQQAWEFIRQKPGNPCIVLPTGAGKSLVIAMIARDVVAWKGRALVLAHRAELLKQNAEKISSCLPGLDVGVFSAGLGKKDHGQDVVVAGVQSCYKKKAAYNIGHRDILIVDEAHLIPLSGDGMYRQLLEHLLAINPRMRVMGLTATPYRLDHGEVCSEENLLTEICYEVPLLKLIEDGFLCPLVSKDPVHTMHLEGVGTRGGEYIQSQLDTQAAQSDVVRAAALELLGWTMERKSVLLFSPGRKHARMLMDHLASQVPMEQVAYIDGLTPPGERASTLEAFKAGHKKYLINIDVLTTGFDAPNVDCVGLFRPTLSPGLLYQMVGRGFRLHPSKQNCLVLDFAGNISRHGPIDQLKAPDRKRRGDGTPGEAPTKSCPQCRELIILQAKECTACGYAFPEPEAKHDAKASELPVLSNGKREPVIEWVEVTKEPTYMVYKPSGKEHRTLRVIYKLAGTQAFCEYICLEHPRDSYACKKAREWWRKRSDIQPPETCWEAYHLLKNCPQALASPARMLLKWLPGKKWPEIMEVELGPKEPIDPMALEEAQAIAGISSTLFKK